MVRIRSNITGLFGEKSRVPSCRASSCLSNLWVGCSLPNSLPFIRFGFSVQCGNLQSLCLPVFLKSEHIFLDYLHFVTISFFFMV